MYARYTHEGDKFTDYHVNVEDATAFELAYWGTGYYVGSIRSGPHETLYRTPIECGWGQMVKHDYDFIGRENLEKAANPWHMMVTLEWNPRNVTDVFAFRLKVGELHKYGILRGQDPCDRRATVLYLAHHVAAGTCIMFYQDKALVDGYVQLVLL